MFCAITRPFFTMRTISVHYIYNLAVNVGIGVFILMQIMLIRLLQISNPKSVIQVVK